MYTGWQLVIHVCHWQVLYNTKSIYVFRVIELGVGSKASMTITVPFYVVWIGCTKAESLCLELWTLNFACRSVFRRCHLSSVSAACRDLVYPRCLLEECSISHKLSSHASIPLAHHLLLSLSPPTASPTTLNLLALLNWTFQQPNHLMVEGHSAMLVCPCGNHSLSHDLTNKGLLGLLSQVQVLSSYHTGTALYSSHQ